MESHHTWQNYCSIDNRIKEDDKNLQNMNSICAIDSKKKSLLIVVVSRKVPVVCPVTGGVRDVEGMVKSLLQIFCRSFV